MRKVILLLILLPFTAVANFYEGTITLSNGSSKVGLIEIPLGMQEPLQFKTDAKAKPESISIDEVSGFEINGGKRSEATKFFAIYLAKGALYGPKDCKVDKKKSWVRLEKEGKINLYSSYIAARPALRMGAARASGWPAKTVFFLKRPDKDYATFFWMHMESGGGMVAVNNYSVIKRLTREHFEGNCPDLHNYVEKEDFKTNGIERIVELYDEHCG